MATRPEAAPVDSQPTGGVLTVMEAINWIAFEDASDADLSGALEIAAFWTYRPSSNGTTSEMLYALREKAGLLLPSDQSRVTSHSPDPSWLVGGRQCADDLIHREQQPAWALARLLERELYRYRKRLRYLEGARRALFEALIDGQLRGKATKVGDGSLAAEIPAVEFMTPGLAIGNNGQVSIRGATVYEGLHFYINDIALLWPPTAQIDAPLPNSPGIADPAAEPTPDIDRAREWMAANVDTRAKRADAILRCRKEAKVTDRVARAAWTLLDSALKGTPGARKGGVSS